MKNALFIGGSSPEKVMRLTFSHKAITVICTSQAQRRDNWQFRTMAGVHVIVADPLAISPDVQKNFDRSFDAVYVDGNFPAFVQKAVDFVKDTGKVVEL